MKKINIFIILIILLSIGLGILLFNMFNKEEVIANEDYDFAYSQYKLDINNYDYISSTINENKAYILYQKNDTYLIKVIDTLTNSISSNTLSTSKECSLQNENNNPYIVCKNSSNMVLYNTNFKKIKEYSSISTGDYAIYTNNTYNVYHSSNSTYPTVVDLICDGSCYFIRENNKTMAVYKENALKEENVSNYFTYESGFVTYSNNKLKIYNVKSSSNAKEFNTLIDLDNSILSLSSNNYYLYVVNEDNIDVYDLYNEEKKASFKINVDDNINDIRVYEDSLYIFTDSILYAYEISALQTGNSTSSSEEELINAKISDLFTNYSVTVSLSNPNNLSTSYNMKAVSNYNDIAFAIEQLEDFCSLFNKDFFKRFYEYTMDGIDIYFASEIEGTDETFEDSEVIGVAFKKDEHYYIVLQLTSDSDIKNVLAHEIMHIIDYYLELKGYSYNWNSLNYSGFSYTNVYYPNKVYRDVLGSSASSDNIYFIDNYARCNEREDRARIMEYIIGNKSLDNYTHLKKKEDYLKSALLSNFPELKNASIFS